MFREIDADCYIMADGDNTYPASFAPVLQRLVLSGKADMAIGDRLSSSYFTENKRPFHNFGNRLVRGLINRLFKAKVNDIMTGARAFSRDFVKSFAVFSKGFEIETEMTIFALEHNFKIAEVPIEYRDRDADNPSKLSTYSDGYKVIKTIFRLLRDDRPGTFFGTLGVVSILIGMGFFVPIVVEYANTGLVPKYPTLIVLTAFWVMGIVSIFSGMVLSVVNARARQEFERFLNLLHIIDAGTSVRDYDCTDLAEAGGRYWKGWNE